MKRKNFVLIVCLLFMGLAAGASLAQAQVVKYDTTYFDICLPAKAEILTRKEFEQGLYENDPVKRAGAYTENAPSFVTDSTMELVGSGLNKQEGIEILVYDVNEKYVTTGREREKILDEYNRMFEQMEAENADMVISDAQIFRTDGANFVYADVLYENGKYDDFVRRYHFTFPWKGKTKVFQLSVLMVNDYADPECVRVVEECLETLYIKH